MAQHKEEPTLLKRSVHLGSVARSRLKPLKGLFGTLLHAPEPCPGRIELEGKTGTKWNTVRGKMRQMRHYIRDIRDSVSFKHLRLTSAILLRYTNFSLCLTKKPIRFLLRRGLDEPSTIIATRYPVSTRKSGVKLNASIHNLGSNII